MNNFAPDIADTLFVWNVLSQAKDGVNPYGKNVAEIYVKHLIPIRFEVEDEADAWKQASKNLHIVLKNFCDLNSVNASVNGKRLGDWMDTYELRHKCDVLIYKEEPKPIKNKTKKKKGKQYG